MLKRVFTVNNKNENFRLNKNDLSLRKSLRIYLFLKERLRLHMTTEVASFHTTGWNQIVRVQMKN